MHEFLNTWYGMLIFIVVDIAAIIAVLAIAYKFFCKRLISVLLSALCLVVTSPAFLWVYLKYRKYKQAGGEVAGFLRRDPVVGKGGETVWMTTFETRKEDGEVAGEYGQGLEERAIRTLPRLLDVFFGRAAFVGVSAIRFEDAAFLDDAQEMRYETRIGLISPLKQGAEMDVQEVLDAEGEYAENYHFFADAKVFFGYLLSKIRGEKHERLDTGYAKYLFDKKEITEEEYTSVLGSAADEEKEWFESRKPAEKPEEKSDEKEEKETSQKEENE